MPQKPSNAITQLQTLLHQSNLSYWSHSSNRISRLTAIVALVIVATCLSAAIAQEKTWKAGVAKAVITPEKSVWLAGYGTKRAPDGVLHDLWMKALTLEDADGNRAVLITKKRHDKNLPAPSDDQSACAPVSRR